MDNNTGVASNCIRGTAGELLFCFESFNRGLQPCVPWGDPSCFDIVIINKKTGRPAVVQVRTASVKNSIGDSGMRWQCKARCNNDRTHLRDTNVQVLASYCAQPKAWYLIPVKKIVANSVNLYPHVPTSKGQYESFKERWSAFGFSSGDQALLS